MNKLLVALLLLAITGGYSLERNKREYSEDINVIRKNYATKNNLPELKPLARSNDLVTKAEQICTKCTNKNKISPGRQDYTIMTFTAKNLPPSTHPENYEDFVSHPKAVEYGGCKTNKCEQYDNVLILKLSDGAPETSSEKSSETSSSSVNSLMIIMGIALVFVA